MRLPACTCTHPANDFEPSSHSVDCAVWTGQPADARPTPVEARLDAALRTIHSELNKIESSGQNGGQFAQGMLHTVELIRPHLPTLTPADGTADAAPDDELREQYAAAMLEHSISNEADADGNRWCSCAGWQENPDEFWDHHMADVFLTVRDRSTKQLTDAIARVRAIKKSPSVRSSSSYVRAQDSGWDEALTEVHAALDGPLLTADEPVPCQLTDEPGPAAGA
jgi:hypothetical protein